MISIWDSIFFYCSSCRRVVHHLMVDVFHLFVAFFLSFSIFFSCSSVVRIPILLLVFVFIIPSLLTNLFRKNYFTTENRFTPMISQCLLPLNPCNTQRLNEFTFKSKNNGFPLAMLFLSPLLHLSTYIKYTRNVWIFLCVELFSFIFIEFLLLDAKTAWDQLRLSYVCVVIFLSKPKI